MSVACPTRYGNTNRMRRARGIIQRHVDAVAAVAGSEPDTTTDYQHRHQARSAKGCEVGRAHPHLGYISLSIKTLRYSNSVSSVMATGIVRHVIRLVKVEANAPRPRSRSH